MGREIQVISKNLISFYITQQFVLVISF